MSHWAEDQARFMIAGDQTVTRWNLEQAERYAKHIGEEARELKEAFDEEDYTKAVDGAVDAIVVSIGFLLSLGVNPYRCWDAVHAANMRKIVAGSMFRREDGQIGKPPGWYGPESELEQIVIEARKHG